ALVGIPQNERSVSVGDGKGLRVRAERHRARDRALASLHTSLRASAFDVPETKGEIPSTRSERLLVGARSDRIDGAEALREAVARARGPGADGPVPARRDEAIVVEEDERHDDVCVALEAGTERLARRRVPQADAEGVARRRQAFAVRAEGDRVARARPAKERL